MRLFDMRDIVQDAWNELRHHNDESVVVRPSMPILYFGDRPRFDASPHKIITVGLNPSKAEFPPADPFLRHAIYHRMK